MSHLGEILRQKRRPAGGVLLALFSFGALIFAESLGALHSDRVGPLLMAALIGGFGGPLLVAWELRRLPRHVLGGERVIDVLRDSMRGTGVIKWQIVRVFVTYTIGSVTTIIAIAEMDANTTTAILLLGSMLVAAREMLFPRKPRPGRPVRRRQVSSLLWLVPALGGIALLTRVWEGEFNVAGLVAAGIGAVCYANFILSMNRMGEINEDAVETGMAVATLASIVVLALLAGGALIVASAIGQPVLGVSMPEGDWFWSLLGIFVLAGFLLDPVTVITQSQIFSKGLITVATFSVLTATEPVFGLVADIWLFHHDLTTIDVLGTLAAVIAGAGIFWQLEFRSTVTPPEGAGEAPSAK